MSPRIWLWAGTALDILVFAPAAYMAVGALEIYEQSDASPETVGIMFLFFALPVFCIAAPLAAWRAQRRGRPFGTIVGLLAAPLVYAAFLVVFLFYGG